MIETIFVHDAISAAVLRDMLNGDWRISDINICHQLGIVYILKKKE